HRPEKVLFIELSEMGSTILADPAMHKLEKPRELVAIFLIFERCKESLWLLPTVPAHHVCTSTCMITNDSGPAHFASITEMPTFVLFGPETPQFYGPLGQTTPIYAGLACSPCVAATNHRPNILY